MSLLMVTPAAAEEWITLTIPLEQGRYYSAQSFRRECCEKLGTAFSIESAVDRRLELTGTERAALLLANETQLLRARIEPTRLILSLPNPEDDRVRRANRRRLERLLGISIREWPAVKGLHLPEDFDPRKRTVLLIPGLRADLEKLQRLKAACDDWSIQTVQFNYPNNGPLAWSGDRLSDELKQLAKEHPSARLVVVAHSMGGLVVRHCLESPDKDPGNVTEVFFLGTPHKGSALAVAHDVLDLVEPFPTGADIVRSLRDGLGEAGADLLPDSHFLAQLNVRQRPKRVQYHAAIGRKSFLTDQQQQVIQKPLGALLDNPDLAASTRRYAKALIQAEELRTGTGDGVVSVASARLEGIESQKVFDLNHLELLLLPGRAPQQSEVFQWIVQTLQWRRGDRR